MVVTLKVIVLHSTQEERRQVLLSTVQKYVFSSGKQTAGFSLTVNRNFVIPKNAILMDNASTVDLIHNRDLLENIHTVGHRIYIHCNAGTRFTDRQGCLPGYGLVWHCPKAIANILSLHNVSHRYWVEFNNEEDNRFVVTKEDGKVKIDCTTSMQRQQRIKMQRF